MWISRASFLIQSLNLISICAVHHCLYCFFEMTAHTTYLRLDSDFKYLASASHPFVLHLKVDATWQDTHSPVVKTHKSKECWIIHSNLLSDSSLWACTHVLLGASGGVASGAAGLCPSPAPHCSAGRGRGPACWASAGLQVIRADGWCGYLGNRLSLTNSTLGFG